MSKIFWVDTETTGLDPVKNEPWEIAGFMEINGKVVGDPIHLRCKPRRPENFSEKALEMSGLNLDEIMSFMDPGVAYMRLVAWLSVHISRFDKFDKAIIAGYNSKFDKDFLYHWFVDSGDMFFHSYFHYYNLCLYNLLQACFALGTYPKNVSRLKLEQIAPFLNISLDAHEAMSDIKATKDIFDAYFRNFFSTIKLQGIINE